MMLKLSLGSLNKPNAASVFGQFSLRRTGVAVLLVGISVVSSACGSTQELAADNATQSARAGSVTTGQASWYGPGFYGNRTANGEIYRPGTMTAAHRTLPFNTMVCVKNLNNGREAVVRINDRGPFVGNRIIDLGHGAAQALGVSGLARVRLTILDRTSTSCRSAADVAQEIAKECKKSVVTQPHTDEAGQSFLKIVLNGSSCPATKVVPFFDGAVSKADAAPAGVFQKANNGSRVALIPLQAGASSVVIKLQTNDTVHYTLPSIAIASEPLEGAPERVDQVQDGLGIPETNTPNPSTDSGLTQDEPVSDEI